VLIDLPAANPPLGLVDNPPDRLQPRAILRDDPLQFEAIQFVATLRSVRGRAFARASRVDAAGGRCPGRPRGLALRLLTGRATSFAPRLAWAGSCAGLPGSCALRAFALRAGLALSLGPRLS
jgi:hypothetical protein